jgi:hypothetical protein
VDRVCSLWCREPGVRGYETGREPHDADVRESPGALLPVRGGRDMGDADQRGRSNGSRSLRMSRLLIARFTSGPDDLLCRDVVDEQYIHARKASTGATTTSGGNDEVRLATLQAPPPHN